MTRTRVDRSAGLLVPATALALLAAACIGGNAGPVETVPPTTTKIGNTDAYTYQLVCPSPIGELSTAIQFTVTDSNEDVRSGSTVTYRINAPLAQVKAPVTPTFVSSTTTYAVPAGFQVTSAQMDPTSNQDFASATTQVGDGTVAFTIKGSFPLDGTPRAVPTLVVEGKVTAPAGSTITWSTPKSIVGVGSVPVLGDQTSSCSFPTTGPIGTTNVAS